MAKPSFRLNHIALLQAVMTSHTLTEAAQRLHVSQPAISKQLKQLQADLGFVLFERRGHRLLPTFEARAMLDQVTRVNASLEVLNQLAGEFRTARRGHLQIGCIPSAAVHLLPRALQAALGAEMGMLCTVHTGNSAQVTEWIQTQQVDVAVAMKVHDAERLGYAPLLELRIECLMPARHPLAAKASLVPADLLPYALIGIELPASVAPSRESPAWDEGLAGAVRIRVDSSHVACSMAEAGLGIAVADSMTVAAVARKSLVRRPLRHPYWAEIGVYRPSYRPRTGMVDDLMARLLERAEALKPLPARRPGR